LERKTERVGKLLRVMYLIKTLASYLERGNTSSRIEKEEGMGERRDEGWVNQKRRSPDFLRPKCRNEVNFLKKGLIHPPEVTYKELSPKGRVGRRNWPKTSTWVGRGCSKGEGTNTENYSNRVPRGKASEKE